MERSLEGWGGNIFPSQKLTDKEKRRHFGSVEKWAQSVIESIEEAIAFNRGNGYGDKRRMSVNLRLAEHGKFDMGLVLSLLEPYMDVGDFLRRFPDVPSHYDIVSPRLNLLRGEEINRPFNFIAVDRSSDALSRAQKMRSDLVFNLLLQEFALDLHRMMRGQSIGGGFGGSSVSSPPFSEGDNFVLGEVPYPVTDGDGNPLNTLEDVNRYMAYGYSDMGEKVANDILRYLIQDLGLEYKMNYNFFKYLCTGMEVFYVGEEGGNPVVRLVDPLLFDCEASQETRFIEDCAWTREVRYLTAPEVYDMFWEEFTEEDVKYVEGAKGSLYDVGGFGSEEFEYLNLSTSGGSTLVRVARFEWQSLRKIGIVYNYDLETGALDKQIVDEHTPIPEGVKVYWYWVNERWEGYKIGDGLYKRLRPIPRKLTSIDDIFKTYSSYVGVREPYSFLDRLIPYQYLFNVVFHKLKLNIARDKGPAFVMDISQLPNTDGWTLDKWMNVLDTMNIAFINSYNEKEGVRHTFNQFAMLDRSTSGSTQYYISILQFIIQFVAEITGISKQREGQTQPRETAAGIERSVTQSTATTEPWFYVHNEVKRRVLGRLLDEAKAVYKSSKKIMFVLDDLGKKFIDVVEDFKNSELGVFVTNSSFDLKILESLKQVAQISLQQKEITLKDFITSVKSQSITEIEHILLAAEKYNQQKQMEMQRVQSEQARAVEEERRKTMAEELKMRTAAELEVERSKADAALELQRLKNEGAIEVAKIGAEAKILTSDLGLDVDTDNNNIPDMIERERLAFERHKLGVETRLKEKEMALKERQLARKDAVAAERSRLQMEKDQFKHQKDLETIENEYGGI